MTEGRARQRVAPETFELPVERIRDGFYTEAYFNHAARRSWQTAAIQGVLMQIFQRKEAVLGGMDEALAVLKLCHTRGTSLVGSDGLQVVLLRPRRRTRKAGLVADAPCLPHAPDRSEAGAEAHLTWSQG